MDVTGGAAAGEAGAATESGGPRVRLECECSSVLCFAMEQNGVPLVREIAVENVGAAALRGVALEVTVEPGLSEPFRVELGELAPGERVVRRALDLPLSPGRLREVTEAEVGAVRVKVLVGGTPAAEHRAPVRVLAFNEWPGAAAPTALLSAFALPNHPVITALLQSVREELRRASVPDAIDGYQTGDPRRARELVEALYRAVQALGIGYVGLPASFEQAGQKIRLPDATVGDRLGCCLDLALLFAAALEQMGLAPLVFLVKGHALAGAWLRDERFPEGVVEDAARVRTLVQLGQLVPFEATAVTSAERPAFEVAARLGLERLLDDAPFRCALDVRVVRAEYRPLPVRTVRPAKPEEPGAVGPETHPGAGEAAQALAARLLARATALPPPPEVAPPPPPGDVAQRFRRWKERLLDLSLRNRLLNFRLDGKGACQLAVPDLELLEDGLFAGRTFALLPRPDVDGRDERDPALSERKVLEVARQRRLEDLGKLLVHTRHGADELWTRLKHLDREARTALEEGGAWILYLAIGFLRWYETPSSPDALAAPILLYPVELRFDPRVRRAAVRRVQDDPVLNVTLLERLRRDHAIDVEAVAALVTAERTRDGAEAGLDVAALLTRFREVVQRVPRWEVLEEAHLGLFSFTKFLMWKDLDENADRFLESPVVRRIAARELVALDQEPLVRPEEVDARHPADLPTVLDADSTQLAAIASSLEGQSFVLQGPPGTGKSQTIANLIAANVARGRTVLFVSEKMAALEVVHRRLCDVGLADFCLELHSHKANKKDVVESLRAALVHARAAPADGWREHGDRLLEARRHADRYVEALHRPRAIGASVYEMRSRLHVLRGTPDVVASPEAVARLDADRYGALREQVEELAGVAAGVEPAPSHPFRGADRTEWSGGLEEQVRGAVSTAQARAQAWEGARARLARVAGAATATCAGAEELARVAAAAELECTAGPALDPAWPRSAARARACVEARQLARSRREDLDRRWAPSLHDLDPAPLVAKLERWAGRFFLLAWIMLFGTRRRLRPHARGPLLANAALLADLRVAALLREGAAALAAETAWAGALLGTGPEGAPERWAELVDRLDGVHAAVSRLQRLGEAGDETLRAVAGAGAVATDPLRRRALAEAGNAAALAAAGLREAEGALGALLALGPGALPAWDDARHLPALSARLEEWGRSLRRLRGWCLYRAAAHGLAAAGFPELPAAHAAGAVPASALGHALEQAVLRAAHAAAVDADPELRDFDAGRHSRRVAHFVELDRAHLAASRRFVASALEAKLPSLTAAEIASSEPALVMREAQKKARHLPVRKLLQQLPSVLPRLKPCLLMSPMSVAQYLPAGGLPFDLVVFDEASQIATHDAVGAIARGRQVIVVGDSRQMPPTSFFTRTEREDELPDEHDVVELESVLDEAVAKLIPQQWLGWHYRSRHESLIDFSNRNIYEGRLDVFPAAQFASEEVGVHWRRVPDGVYRPGGGAEGRTNRREAEALVAYLVERFRAFAPGERTFGVVTFNLPQQHLILDLLDDARVDPLVDRHFDGLERVFVKNLENVQGDERDEIAFSICSAPDANGRFSVAVGALNMAGGERRLNVAITRARRKLVVFSSIEPELIDRSRTKSRGVWLLRDFLQFARDGRTAGRTQGDGAALGALERAMAETLRADGLEVDAGVGCSGYRLDLAVRDPVRPGRYGVAVESDGPAYRMARSARDRDRLRGQVLASMGWRLERVWSTGWWYDEAAPAALASRVKAALEAPVDADRHAGAPGAVQPALAREPVAEVLAPAPSPPATVPLAASPPQEATRAPRPGSPYRVTALPAPGGDADAYAAPRAARQIREQVAAVIAAEGPVHLKVLARRVAEAWGIPSLTAVPMRRVTEQVEALAASGQAAVRGEFIWPAGVDPATWRDFRTGEEGEAARELPHVPPEEIACAAEWLLREAGSLERDVLAREVARLFGVARVGANVREALEAGLRILLAAGRAVEREGRVAAG
jgi:hypothetical protein